MHEHGRTREVEAVMRCQIDIECSEQVVRTNQVVFLVPGEVAQIEHPEPSVSEHDTDRKRILGMVDLVRLVLGT